MEKIVFAGSFDPLANGHLWVIEQGLEMAQKVLVFVAHNNNKKTMFTALERKQMIEQVCVERNLQDKVEVHIIQNEYVAKKALQMGASHMIRGIRSSIDFDYEALLQKTNTDVLHGAKTVFVMPPRDLESVSSSFVKSLIGPVGWHWQIKEFLPKAVYQKWLEVFITQTAKEFINSSQVDKLISDVISNYSSPTRHYHNLDHVVHCLEEMIWLKNHWEKSNVDFEQLTVAILAHDIIYGAKQEQSDEQLSAQYVLDVLGSKFQKAYELVLATQHLAQNQKQYDDAEKVMRSLDLAILGQEWDIYKQYANNVRKEYSFVPDEQYKMGRTQALTTLLAHGNLYESNHFSHYEKNAQNNLKQEIELLNKQ